jgi:HK97 family phage major capsid protein
MSNDTLIVPNQTGSTTVYHVGENSAFTPADFAFTGVNLTAIKMGAYNIVSRELSEDTIIDYASMAARDFALKLAQQEDLDTFLGDGTATYGGITGILPAVYGVSTTKADIASLVLTPLATASPNTFKPTLANLRDMVGRVRFYPGLNPKWFMNRQFWYECVAPLLDSLNGNTIGDIQNAYQQQPTLYGYPVVFTQVMDRFAAATRPLALFGDPSMGTAFGDRRGITIEMSDQRYFLEDQIAYKASERFAFNAYDLGNAAALATNKVPGCLIALYSQAT